MSLVLASSPTHAHKHVPKHTEGHWSQGGSTILRKRHKSFGSSMSSGRPGIWACPLMKACLGSSVWPYHGQSQSFPRTSLYDLYYETWDITDPACGPEVREMCRKSECPVLWQGLIFKKDGLHPADPPPPTNTVLAGESELCLGQQVPEQREFSCKNQNQAGCL